MRHGIFIKVGVVLDPDGMDSVRDVREACGCGKGAGVIGRDIVKATLAH